MTLFPFFLFFKKLLDTISRDEFLILFSPFSVRMIVANLYDLFESIVKLQLF